MIGSGHLTLVCAAVRLYGAWTTGERDAWLGTERDSMISTCSSKGKREKAWDSLDAVEALLITLGGNVVGRVSSTLVDLNIWLGGLVIAVPDLNSERLGVVSSKTARHGRAMTWWEAARVFHIGMVFWGGGTPGIDDATVRSSGSLGAGGYGYGQGDWLEEEHFQKSFALFLELMK